MKRRGHQPFVVATNALSGSTRREPRRRRQSAGDSAEANQRAIDVKLVQQIQSGDEAALEQFYDRYSALVYAVCLRVLGQTADAEETMVEVFWEIWDKPHRYDERRGSVVSYLMVLARSRAIDRRRSRTSHAAVTLDNHDGDGERARPPAIPATTPEPIDDARLSEQRHHVVQGLDLLTPAQREAVVLSFFQGLSHQQIAVQLDEPLGTIKTRIRQGIIRLRDGLRNLDGGP